MVLRGCMRHWRGLRGFTSTSLAAEPRQNRAGATDVDAPADCCSLIALPLTRRSRRGGPAGRPLTRVCFSRRLRWFSRLRPAAPAQHLPPRPEDLRL